MKKKFILQSANKENTLKTKAVLFRLFPKTVNLPPKPVGFRLTVSLFNCLT